MCVIIYSGYPVGVDYRHEFQKKRRELGVVCKKIQVSLVAKNIPVSEVISTLSLAYDELEPDLKPCNTILEVLTVLRSRTTLDDIEYLMPLVEEYNLTEDDDFIGEFNRSIEDFCNHMKMRHTYGQSFTNDFKRCPLKSERVTFVLDWDADEKLLKDLKGLFKKVFREYSPHLQILVTREGNSIIVECYLPSRLHGVFTRLVEDAEQILNEEKVISVNIGGFGVFKRSTEVHVAYIHTRYKNYSKFSNI